MRRFSRFSSLFAGSPAQQREQPFADPLYHRGRGEIRVLGELQSRDDLLGQCRQFDQLDLAFDRRRIRSDTRKHFSGGDARLSGIHQHDGRRLVARRYDSEHADDENHGRHRHRRDQPSAPTNDEPEASQAAYAAARNSDVSRRPLGGIAGGIVIECRIASVVTNQHLWGLFGGRALPPRQSTFGRSNPILCDFNVNRRTRADALFTTHFWLCAAKG